jgi:hypothetical protein
LPINLIIKRFPAVVANFWPIKLKKYTQILSKLSVKKLFKALIANRMPLSIYDFLYVIFIFNELHSKKNSIIASNKLDEKNI